MRVKLPGGHEFDELWVYQIVLGGFGLVSLARDNLVIGLASFALMAVVARVSANRPTTAH